MKRFSKTQHRDFPGHTAWIVWEPETLMIVGMAIKAPREARDKYPYLMVVHGDDGKPTGVRAKSRDEAADIIIKTYRAKEASGEYRT